ncbi:MAG: transposase [Planctomycetes bacterium]|nr:transposase [Planctomycetota bacterium]
MQYHVKDGQKGPMVVEAKRMAFWIKDEAGLPSRPNLLLVVRPMLHPKEVKFFLSNASESTSTEVLLLVAYSRWRIERIFQDTKSELGMDHFEVRKYVSIQRHLILTCLSHLFLAEFCLKHRGEKPRAHRPPGTHRHPDLGLRLEPAWTMLSSTG